MKKPFEGVTLSTRNVHVQCTINILSLGIETRNPLMATAFHLDPCLRLDKDLQASVSALGPSAAVPFSGRDMSPSAAHSTTHLL